MTTSAGIGDCFLCGEHPPKVFHGGKWGAGICSPCARAAVAALGDGEATVERSFGDCAATLAALRWAHDRVVKWNDGVRCIEERIAALEAAPRAEVAKAMADDPDLWPYARMEPEVAKPACGTCGGAGIEFKLYEGAAVAESTCPVCQPVASAPAKGCGNATVTFHQCGDFPGREFLCSQCRAGATKETP